MLHKIHWLLENTPVIEIAIVMLALRVAWPLRAQAKGTTEKVIYAFHNGSNGAYPSGGLAVDAAGNFYGTTEAGGNAGGYDGLGTVFELTPPA